MKKILFSIALVLSILLATTTYTCAEELTSSMEKTGNSIKNAVAGAENKLDNGAKDLGTTLEHGINSITNTNDYTAERTSANGGQTSTNFMNTETWSWIIIGVVVVAIINLFWYYADRTKNHTHRD